MASNLSLKPLNSSNLYHRRKLESNKKDILQSEVAELETLLNSLTAESEPKMKPKPLPKLPGFNEIVTPITTELFKPKLSVKIPIHLNRYSILSWQ